MARPGPVTPRRAEAAAATISNLVRAATPGERLGTREELRARCDVSVGTFHEALRLLQSTGEIVVRSGPGGGVFAGESSALARLVGTVRAEPGALADFPQIDRVMRALSPLIIEDAIAALSPDTEETLRGRRDALVLAARQGELRDVVRASLELYATLVSLPPAGVLRAIAASILRVEIDGLRLINDPIEPRWRESVDQHVAAVGALVTAILARDLTGALAIRERPGFMTVFESVERDSAV